MKYKGYKVFIADKEALVLYILICVALTLIISSFAGTITFLVAPIAFAVHFKFELDRLIRMKEAEEE